MAEPPDFRRKQGYLSIVPHPDAFTLKPVKIKPPHLIKPRQWIYGTWLCRGFVTLLVASGGTGKTSLALAVCVAIATKRPLFGMPIHEQCNTALLQLEDPQEEIDRRLAALSLYYNINDDDLNGRFLMSPAEQKVLIAAPSDDGFDVVYPDQVAIIERIRDEKIGVLAVDPFAESHQLEENSNPQMVRASTAWRRVARECNCAVLLLHHIRKGLADSIEAARGAKALTDSARVGLLMASMTPEEAGKYGISEDDRYSYIRCDPAKANMAPRSSGATWFHLSNVELKNGDDIHPAGDRVAVIERWQPEAPLDGISTEDCNLALDRIEAGVDGQSYTSARQSKKRWAGLVLKELFGKNNHQAAEIIRIWLANGVLFEEQQWTAQGNKRFALKVNNANRPGTVIL